MLPARRILPSTARAAASCSICSVTKHCSITAAARSLAFSSSANYMMRPHRSQISVRVDMFAQSELKKLAARVFSSYSRV